MSRKRAKRPSVPVREYKRPGANLPGLSLSGRITMDELLNEYARLGGQENLLGVSRYQAQRITQNYGLLNTLYRGSWIVGRIIDVVAEDMIKNWYKLSCQTEPDQESMLVQVERKARVKESMLEGLKWGRLYGGAAGVIVVDGQEDMLDRPLDLNMIAPGSFKGILIADRWSGVYPSTELVTDIADPDNGLPEYYTFSMDEANLDYGVRVHHSRVLRFSGKRLPWIERVTEEHWGMSEVERVFEELNKRNATSANIAQLIFQAHLRVLKMENMGQDLAFMDSELSGDLYRTLQAQNKLMNNMSLQILSKDDDFQTFQYTFSGLSEVYELFMMDLAGAAEIPVTRLFGRSPAGLNATGESDLTNYYDKIAKDQKALLSPVLDKLLPILCLSAWGEIPDDLDYVFNPIRDTGDEERASLIQQSAAAINTAFQSGLISQKIALKELRESGRPLNMWTNITDEDIENADDTMGQQEEGMLPGMLPGGPEGDMPEAPEAQPPEPPRQPFRQQEKVSEDAGNGLMDRLKEALMGVLTRDHNDNHDPDNGQFASKSGGGSGDESGIGTEEEKRANGAGSKTEKKKTESPKTRNISRQVFQERLSKGEINTKLRITGGINKHNPKSNEYQRHSRQRQKNGKPPASMFTITNPAELKNEILSDQVQSTAKTIEQNGIIKQEVCLDRQIGIAYNKKREKIATNWVKVEYSPIDGMHYYPIIPPVGKG